jgi:hypothetical protein
MRWWPSAMTWQRQCARPVSGITNRPPTGGCPHQEGELTKSATTFGALAINGTQLRLAGSVSDPGRHQ